MHVDSTREVNGVKQWEAKKIGAYDWENDSANLDG